MTNKKKEQFKKLNNLRKKCRNLLRNSYKQTNQICGNKNVNKEG